MKRFDELVVEWGKAVGLAGRVRCVDATRATDPDGLRLGLCYEDGVLRAVVANRAPAAVCRVLAEDGIGFPAELLIVLGSGEGRGLWRLDQAGWAQVPQDQACQLLSATTVQVEQSLARRVVAAIGEQNRRELEGIQLQRSLRLLDKTFPRDDLYLFELLQNAVDDGALEVEFRLEDERLVVEHTGRPFTAVDVLGLSSVGLSGKGGRTIGFLGIGFKAVYKRFDRVRVCDGTWSFQFERPADASSSGWKLVPTWREDGIQVRGCRFELERPIGGIRGVEEDLKSLPTEVPVLLGRRALRAASNAARNWHLNWNGERWTVTQVGCRPSGIEIFRSIRESMGKKETAHWGFLTVLFDPTTEPEALEAYRQFREEPEAEPDKQEVTLFFQVDERGGAVRCEKGRTFAVLPTELPLPDGMGFHLQANWLPTLDRQGIQRPTDTGTGPGRWNAALARRLPDLLLALLRLLACGGVGNPNAAYAMLPPLRNGQLRLYGLNLDLAPLLTAVRAEPLLPVLPGSGQESLALEFVAAGQTVVDVPADFLGLGSEFLQAWLGKRVFAGAALQGGERFWRSLGVVDPLRATLVERRSAALAERFRGQPDEPTRLREMIGLLGAYHRTRLARDPTWAQVGLDHWRVFPVSGGGLATRSDAVRVKPAYIQLVPPGLRTLLNPHGAPQGKHLIDAALQQAFSDEADRQEFSGQEDARHSIAELPPVEGRDIFARFFNRMGRGPLSEETQREVVELTRWAFGENRHSLIPAVLAETPSGVVLQPPAAVRLGEAYGELEGGPLAGESPVGAAYLKSFADPDWWAQGFRKLLAAASTAVTPVASQPAGMPASQCQDGRQVMARLFETWRRQPSPVDAEARRAILDGLRFLAREVLAARARDSEPDWMKDWNRLHDEGAVLAYCLSPEGDEQRWLSTRCGEAGPLAVYNDSPRKAGCLGRSHQFWPDALLPRIPEVDVRNEAVNLLGLPRLSDGNRFTLSVEVDGAAEALQGPSRRLAVLLRLLRRLKLDEPDANLLPPFNPVVRRCEGIRRSLAGVPVTTPVSAAWMSPAEVFVVGRSTTYFPDLRAETEELFRLDRPEERDLLMALLYLEDPRAFDQELDKRARAARAQEALRDIRAESAELPDSPAPVLRDSTGRSDDRPAQDVETRGPRRHHTFPLGPHAASSQRRCGRGGGCGNVAAEIIQPVCSERHRGPVRPADPFPTRRGPAKHQGRREDRAARSDSGATRSRRVRGLPRAVRP